MNREEHLQQIMQQEGCDRKKARRLLRKMSINENQMTIDEASQKSGKVESEVITPRQANNLIINAMIRKLHNTKK